MKLTILGCSGGIGIGLRTTAMLLDDDVLIDAGTGVGDLTLDQMARIDAVFLTHCHLDHICALPLLADAVGGRRQAPVTIYALEATIDALRIHLFNDCLWPDFSVLPSVDAPYLRYQVVNPGVAVQLGRRRITPLPASHGVPAIGYRLDSGAASLAFTGDTGPCDALWEAVNAIDNLRYLIIETSFAEQDCHIAEASRHLCPSLLAGELARLRLPAEIFITHLKPDDSAATVAEIGRLLPDLPADRPLRLLSRNQVLAF